MIQNAAIDRPNFGQKLQLPVLRDAFEMIEVDSFKSFLAAYTSGAREMLFVGPGPVLTDD